VRLNTFVLCILAFFSMCVGKAPVTDDTLISAIITVESRGNDDAVGDGGRAVGPLQIHAVMVKEVNRILGSDVYTLSDRKDRKKSIAMFKVYTNKYTPSWSPELVARRWNGGPTGDQKKATLKYWNKVQKELP